MSYGCPVITSYAASLPEVGGEASLYFEPKSSQDLLFNLNLLFNDKKLQKELKNKGFERITEFSWEKCAEETLTQLKAMVK
jgi:glycosyltransferase involved in cell wall biosynthesis